LARIDLDDAQLVRLSSQLDVILHSVATVAEVAGADSRPPRTRCP